MSDSRLPNLWRKWLKDVQLAEESPLDEPHVVDNDELLNDWRRGRLDPETADRILGHLDRCGECRTILAEIVRRGGWENGDEFEASSLSDSPSAQDSLEPAHRTDRSPNGSRRILLAVTAVAAALLLVFALRHGGPPGERRLDELASVEDWLARDPERALDILERLVQRNDTPATHAKIAELAEQASYQAARRRLPTGDAEAVASISTRAMKLGADSGRLANLRIQAERGALTEINLATKGELTSYGILLRGRAVTKSLGGPGSERSFEETLRKTLSQYPDSIPLRLNLGQMMLERRDATSAAEQFRRVLRGTPDNPTALIGLGLSEFLSGEIERSKECFERAVALEPRDAAAQLNLAIALERLGDRHSARRHFLQARQLTHNEALRRQIDQLLQ